MKEPAPFIVKKDTIGLEGVPTPVRFPVLRQIPPDVNGPPNPCPYSSFLFAIFIGEMSGIIHFFK